MWKHWKTFGLKEQRIAFSTIQSFPPSLFLDGIKEIALFALHSKEINIPEDDVTYIHFLTEITQCVVVLTTNPLHLHDQDLFDSNVKIIAMSNRGLDFGLWSRFLIHYAKEMQQMHTLLLVNNSCSCIRSLKPIWEKNVQRPVWGITDSYEQKHHLQSYFVVIRTNVLIHKLLVFFEKNMFETTTQRPLIIEKGEVGLSQFLATETDIYAEYPFSELENPRNFSNPSYFLWKLLRKLNCPLIKKKKFKPMPEPR